MPACNFYPEICPANSQFAVPTLARLLKTRLEKTRQVCIYAHPVVWLIYKSVCSLLVSELCVYEYYAKKFSSLPVSLLIPALRGLSQKV